MKKPYTRVIPRDLFNEAKLLKCMGRLTLLELDRMLPCKMIIVHDDSKPFDIQLMEEGSLYIRNIEVFIKEEPAAFIFKTTLNSKANYPMFVEHKSCDYRVFNEAGEFDEEFLEFVKTLS